MIISCDLTVDLPFSRLTLVMTCYKYFSSLHKYYIDEYAVLCHQTKLLDILYIDLSCYDSDNASYLKVRNNQFL